MKLVKFLIKYFVGVISTILLLTVFVLIGITDAEELARVFGVLFKYSALAIQWAIEFITTLF